MNIHISIVSSKKFHLFSQKIQHYNENHCIRKNTFLDGELRKPLRKPHRKTSKSRLLKNILNEISCVVFTIQKLGLT